MSTITFTSQLNVTPKAFEFPRSYADSLTTLNNQTRTTTNNGESTYNYPTNYIANVAGTLYKYNGSEWSPLITPLNTGLKALNTALTTTPSTANTYLKYNGSGYEWATISTTTSGNYLPLTGGSLTGALQISSSDSTNPLIKLTGTKYISIGSNGSSSQVFATNGTIVALPTESSSIDEESIKALQKQVKALVNNIHLEPLAE